MCKKNNTIPVKLPNLVQTSKVEFKKKGKANKHSLTGLKQAKKAIKYKEQAKQQKSRQKKRQQLAVGVYKELKILRSVKSLNISTIPPTLTTPVRLQYLL